MRDNILITPAEVASFYQVSIRTVQRWARSGKLPSVKIDRTLRFPTKVLEYGSYDTVAR